MKSSTDLAYTVASFPQLSAPAETGNRSEGLGYTRGHTAGYTAGLRKGTAEAEARRAEMEAEHAAVLRQAEARTERAVALLTAAAQALDAAALPVLDYAQDTLAAAALELAEAVIGHEITDHEFGAKAALARALSAPAPAAERTIRMHPADLSVIESLQLDGAGAVFVPDASLERGDAVAEYADGTLDARIGSALQRARQTLLGGTA